jgi:DNA-binding CsgD family transcriptional regulator
MASALTPREKEIIRLFSLGCTGVEIGKILKLAPSTVINHKARAMAKLGTDKATLLTRLALKLKVTNMNDKLTPAEKRKSGRKDDGWN